MKLAIDCRMSGKSGIGVFLDNILPTLIENTDNCLLIGLPQTTLEAIKSESHIEKCEVIPCSIKPFSLKEMLFFPRDLLKKINSYDAYFSPYCNVPARIFAGIRVSVFCTIHDIIFLDMPEIAGTVGTLLRKIIYKRAIKKSSGIFSVSNFSKARIEEKLKCKKNIEVAFNAVPKNFKNTKTDNSTTERTATLETSPDKTDTIIFVGNIKRHKGLGTLIPAFVKFKEKIENDLPQPKLLIVGSKENFRTSDTELEKMIFSAEQHGIVFTGFVPDEKLKTLIQEARILVQPSLYEGFGIPPMQALHLGTRALISDIPVFKEIYGTLPVDFFKAGDIEDLSQKLSEVYFDTAPFEPQNTERFYSYEKSAEIILQKINERLEK